jgi:predicted transglutaminase-like cysteine proteinase
MFKRPLTHLVLATSLISGFLTAPLQAAAPVDALSLSTFMTSSCQSASPKLQISALERVRQQQAQDAVPVDKTLVLSSNGSGECTKSTMAVLSSAKPQSVAAFLGTDRIRITRTSFDGAWARVATQKLSAGDFARTVGQAPQDRLSLLAKVNGWVNRNIVYTKDTVLSAQNDYWADAPSTLRSRKGDCEDYAILKMQLLASAGVNEEDMMLTLVRDTLRRNDHAVLLVRYESGWLMLDMASDSLPSASVGYGYMPLISFSANARFIHGVPAAA